jgi:hypothetical protein
MLCHGNTHWYTDTNVSISLKLSLSESQKPVHCIVGLQARIARAGSPSRLPAYVSCAVPNGGCNPASLCGLVGPLCYHAATIHSVPLHDTIRHNTPGSLCHGNAKCIRVASQPLLKWFRQKLTYQASFGSCRPAALPAIHQQSSAPVWQRFQYGVVRIELCAHQVARRTTLPAVLCAQKSGA